MILGNVLRWAASKKLGLPPRTNPIAYEKGLEMKTRDGVVLVADRYFPRDGRLCPTVLLRSPYGRGFLLSFSAALLAERGFNVVVQSVRATDGSGGTFDPFRQELNDGVDAVLWVRSAPWFGSKLFLFGGSYLGCVAWAIARECPDHVDGAALTVTLSNFRDAIREGGGFSLFTMLTWTRQMHDSIKTGKSPFFGGRPVPPNAFEYLPLGTIDANLFGETNNWWQDWIGRDLDDEWWKSMDFSAGVTALQAPTLLIAGWQDLFLPYELADFESRQEAGLPTWITIGPWEHGGPVGLFEGQRQSIEFLTGLATDTPRGPVGRAPVKLFVQGANEWRYYQTWPPEGGKELTLYLHADGNLSPEGPLANAAATSYVYDPADPTPSIYGPVTIPGKSRDLSPYDARTDVASFTCRVPESELEVIGPVTATLFVRTSCKDADLYACLTEVDEAGVANHVCDGFVRLNNTDTDDLADGTRQVRIECWPTAWRFQKGRKLRVYIASACFPRYARNLGTNAPIPQATAMAVNQVEILHSKDHPSSIRLYVPDEDGHSTSPTVH